MAYTLPWKQIVDNVYFGSAQVAKTPYPFYLPSDTTRFWHYDTNIDKAKQLMQAAGKQDGFDLELYYANERPVMDPVAAILQQSFGQIGIRVKLVKAPEATLIDRFIVKKNLPAYVSDTGSPVPPDESVFVFFLLKGGFLNGVNYANPEWDALFVKGLSTLNPALRKAVYTDVQRIFYNDLPLIPITTFYETVVVDDKVGSYTWRPDHATGFAEIRPAG
jgi:peptide/nickel transport system substrate-binding protein